MAPKAKKGRKKAPKKGKIMIGGAWYNNWNDFKSGVSNVYNGVKKGYDYVKDNKLVSRGLDIAGRLGVPNAAGYADRARQAGYGKRRMQSGGAMPVRF
jgi:hypothetical protein